MNQTYYVPMALQVLGRRLDQFTEAAANCPRHSMVENSHKPWTQVWRESWPRNYLIGLLMVLLLYEGAIFE